MSPERWIVRGGALALLVASPSLAAAGSFDPQGNYFPDPSAVDTQGFGSDFDPESDRYVPADADPGCAAPAFTQVQGDDAIDGTDYLHLDVDTQKLFDLGCLERFLVTVPAGQSAYVGRVWIRHGSVEATLTVAYPDEVGIAPLSAKMGPTGRVTSDGWVELASNALPVDGSLDPKVYLRIYDYDGVGSDIDALEIVESGNYWETRSCDGVADSVCGPGAVCIHQSCRLGRLAFPVVPDSEVRAETVSRMQSQLVTFFGGRKTRLEDLPHALATLDAIKEESDPYAFWNGWATAIRQLHDWHTHVDSFGGGVGSRTRLNMCFIAGDADLTHATWPTDPAYPDVLVSHVGGSATWGIEAGDRLVAIDGKHPVEWARSLIAVDGGYWSACDDTVVSEPLERLRGLIAAYATSISIIHCHAGSQTCDAAAETIQIADLPDDDGGGNVGCDNRPFYHVNPNPGSGHHVNYDFYKGLVVESDATEAIYALVWDTLYGGGDPNGYVNGNIKTAYSENKQNARGVILDHRAGNGGTLDAAETMTQLVRPPEVVLVFNSPARLGSWNGPESQTEGITIFQQLSSSAAMHAGSSQWDPEMPVALLIHRDGSASDFGPFGLKGAPNVRIFGPGPTAGAFSTFYNHQYWAGIGLQVASGDSIAFDGRTLIGHGVEPDEVVLQKQSDLLAGKDTIHEAALAWLRTGLKP